ncbi:MAG: GTPase [Bdellovibrionota bacterium]
MATATALGGPIAILRVSGRDLSFLESLVGTLPSPGEAKLRKLMSPEKQFLDEALVLRFVAPHSFTGEDVIEIQGHGVPALVEKIQETIIRLGAIAALPGEFSFRAVLNNKMTLEEASRLQTLFGMEGLGSSSASKLLSFGKSSDERVNKSFDEVLESVAAARGRIEAAIDFAEAESEQAQDIASAEKRLVTVERTLQQLLNSYDVFARNARIPTVILLGRPNAGKSTLLNLLVGGRRSLVSETAGTTRDYVEVQLRTPSGQSFRLLDTAGLRGALESTDSIEMQGMELGLEMMESADVLVWLEDLRSPNETFGNPRVDELFKKKRVLKLFTHVDLADLPPFSGAFFNLIGDKASDASQAVLDFVEKICFERGEEGASVLEESQLISQRQEELCRKALGETREALQCLRGERSLELVGDVLRHLDSLLRSARGEGLTDDYIGQIFTQFCLGK